MGVRKRTRTRMKTKTMTRKQTTPVHPDQEQTKTKQVCKLKRRLRMTLSAHIPHLFLYNPTHDSPSRLVEDIRQQQDPNKIGILAKYWDINIGGGSKDDEWQEQDFDEQERMFRGDLRATAGIGR
jgi:hypothetical protein